MAGLAVTTLQTPNISSVGPANTGGANINVAPPSVYHNVTAAPGAIATFAPGAAPTASSTPGGSTASTSGTGSTTATTTAAAQNNYNNILAGDTASINQGITANAGDYGQSILDAFNGTGGFGSQQSDINQSDIQNELSKDQGMQGVRDMVNNGIQGAGVVLDNDGSGTSSAADAVARAYGVQGRQQASNVGSQYAQGQSAIGSKQGELNTSEANFANVDTPQKKQDVINTIVSNANQMLSYLSAVGSSGNVTNQVDIAQKIAQVKAQATAALSAYDGQVQSQMAGNAAITQPVAQSTAANLFASGTAPANEFNFTSTMPAQLQGSGPSASDLPIYTSSPQNKNDNGITG